MTVGADGPAPAPTFGQALAFWFKLGWISFGGPAGQIALMHQELVERRRWVAEGRFLHALNFCMLLPGPEAQQLATYIGWMLHRTWGGVAAGVLFVLPSLLILIGLSWLYVVHGQQPQVAAVLWGLKPAVVAVVVAAAQRIGARVLHHPLLWAMAGTAFVGLTVLQLPFAVLIGAAAVVGWWARDRVPLAFAAGGEGHGAPAQGDRATAGAHAGERADHADAADAAASPAIQAARSDAVSFRTSIPSALVCLTLWAGTLGALVWAFGAKGTLPQMGAFFTQAALLTFGGAYAVLPYVFQGAVDTHHWLTAAQMMDGLALGETTPGPLIMVVAFVGFLGGAGAQLFGPGEVFWSGAAAAVVVTWFTFLPSFLFILAGAPLVERTEALATWRAPLTAITAAVVGVILHLAVVLAAQVLWSGGLGAGMSLASLQQMDLAALALGIVAWAVLRSGRMGVVPVILLAAAVGALTQLDTLGAGVALGAAAR